MILKQEIIKKFWRLFDLAELDKAGQLMTENVKVKMPNTREFYKDREHFINFNKKYPGRWRITIEKLYETSDNVISVVFVESEDNKNSYYAITIFKFTGNLISSIEEFWSENSEPPKWRIDQKISERY